jgi:hypothetical protein
MHSSNFDGLVAYDALGYSRPMAGSGVGLTLVRLTVKDIPFTANALIDINGNGVMDPGERLDYAKITSESDAESALLLNYSRTLRQDASWGANLKVVNKSVGGYAAWGAGLDLGVIARLHHNVRVGINLQDITTTYLAWDTGRRELITPTAKAGISWHPPIRGETPLTLAAGTDLRFEGRRTAANFHLGGMSGDWRLGLEFWLKRRLAFRAGIDQGHLAAGAGLRLGRLGFDYAYLSNEDLGSSTRLAGSFGF